MIDLSERSGLPLQLKDEKLVFGKGMLKVKPDVRSLQEMKPVLLDENVKGPKELYYMYRDVMLTKDKKHFEKHFYRYDITILKPGYLGREHIKTFGHYHEEYKHGVRYPEVYEVIYGKALYLFQTDDDCRIIEAHAGDKVIVPPNYGHATINIGETPLVMSNLGKRRYTSDYDPIRKKHGMMYYEIGGKLIKNPNYEKIPKFRKKKPTKKLGKEPLYTLALNHPQKFEFLKNPNVLKYRIISLVRPFLLDP